MNKARDEIRTLWVRQLSGEQLNEAESLVLRDALREDRDLQLELSDDATSHALLLSLTDVVQTEEDFVRAVMQKAMAGQEANSVAANSTPLQTAVEATPVGISVQGPSGLPLLVKGQSGSNIRKRSLRHSQQWLAVMLTLGLFVSVGLMFWIQGQGQTEIVSAGSPPKEQAVDQQPEIPAQRNNQEPVTENKLAASDDANSGDVGTPADQNDAPIQLATNDNSSAPGTTQDKSVNSESPNMAEETLPTVVSQPFVTLTKLENPVWEREDSLGSRLGDEVVRLFGGTIELTFDDGAVVTLEGPVEFKPLTAGLLDLRRGQLSATVPKPSIGFTVLTPTSEVVDLGTEFDVSVKDTGASDVIIRKGEVEVAPSGRVGRQIQKWKLVPDGLNHAFFFARPADGKPGPIVAQVKGARGQFQGIISLNRKTAKFRSADTFNDVHQRVMTQLKNSEDGMQRQWQEFVDSMQTTMRGTMNFNGRQLQFGNLDEVMRLRNQLQNQLNIDAGTPFDGSININGKVIRFKTHEEFEAARRAAFGPAANFGAGDLLQDMQRDQDNGNNLQFNADLHPSGGDEVPSAADIVITATSIGVEHDASQETAIPALSGWHSSLCITKERLSVDGGEKVWRLAGLARPLGKGIFATGN